MWLNNASQNLLSYSELGRIEKWIEYDDNLLFVV